MDKNDKTTKMLFQVAGMLLPVLMVVVGLIYGLDRITQIEQQVPTQVAELFPTLAVEWDLAGRLRTPTPGGATATPTASALPTITPPAGATATPVITLTPAPTVLVTVTPGGEIGLCATHDPNAWHALISADGSCHYDHEHKHDPMADCGSQFGEPGAWYGESGRSISYPWQTILEQEHKHEAYAWITRCGIEPNSNPNDESPNFLKNFRVLVHVDPTCFLMPAGNWAGCHIGSQHSISLELEICKKTSPNDCGIFDLGGWMNVGDLNLRDEKGDDITFCAPLPDVSPDCDPSGQTGGGDGGSRIYFDAAGPPFNPDARAHTFFWYGEMSTSDVQTIEVINPTVFAVAIGDSMHEVSLDNLLFQDPLKSIFCPQMDCQFNGSTVSMHEISLNVPGSLDSDGDGYVDGVFWVDQYGRFQSECMTTTEVINPGDLACIPWKFTHVPVGKVKYGDPENMGIGVTGTQDFDTSPPGEFWITWPLRFLEGMEDGH